MVCDAAEGHMWVNGPPELVADQGEAQAQETHIVLVEKCQVSDDTNPDEQCGGAQEDAADVIAG